MRKISSTKELELGEEDFTELWALLTWHCKDIISFEYSLFGNNMNVVFDEKEVKEIKNKVEQILNDIELKDSAKKLLMEFLEFLNREHFLIT